MHIAGTPSGIITFPPAVAGGRTELKKGGRLCGYPYSRTMGVVFDFFKNKGKEIAEGIHSIGIGLSETSSGTKYYSQVVENGMRALKNMLYSTLGKLIQGLQKEQTDAARKIIDKSDQKMNGIEGTKQAAAKVKEGRDILADPSVTNEFIRKRTPEYHALHGTKDVRNINFKGAGSVADAARLAKKGLEHKADLKKEMSGR